MTPQDRAALVARLMMVSAATDGCRIRRDPEAGILCYESRSVEIAEYCDFCAVLCARAALAALQSVQEEP